MKVMRLPQGEVYVFHPTEYERFKRRMLETYPTVPNQPGPDHLFGVPIYLSLFLPHPDSVEYKMDVIKQIFSDALRECREIWATCLGQIEKDLDWALSGGVQ